MGDLVKVNRAKEWFVSMAVGLLLVPALAGAPRAVDDVDATEPQHVVTSEEVAANDYGPVDPDADLGTADNPYNGPPAVGTPASRLVEVSTETFGDTALIQILGDGAFEYAAFQLRDPARFVVDLTGVVKATEQGSLDIGHEIVTHVRVGQYRAEPDPVSRVVFDLNAPAVPRIEPTPEGLAISFDAESLAATFPVPGSESALPAIAMTVAPEKQEAVARAQEEVIEESILEQSAETTGTEAITEAASAEIEALEPQEAVLVAEAPVEPLVESVQEPVQPDYEYVELRLADTEVADLEPATETLAEVEPLAEPRGEAAAEIDAEDVMLAALIEEAPPIIEPQAFEMPAETVVTESTAEMAAEAELELAQADVPVESMPEPMVEPIVEPMVESVPEPEVIAQADEREMPSIEAPGIKMHRSDTALFDVANIQVEEPAEGGDSASPVASFEAQEVGSDRRYQGEPMDLTLQNADVKDVLRSFAQLSGLNLVVQPDVRGSVTVELVQVPWDQAFEQILKINNLGYELDGNIMRVAPIATLRAEAQEQQALLAARALSVPLSTVIRRISYARASEIARVLLARGGVMSNRGTVIVDNRTNTLILKELPSYMNTVIAIIENLDIPEPQVMIEARIIETTKRFSRSLGIQWGFQGVSSAATGNTTGLQFPNNGTVDGGVNLLTGADNGFLNFSLGNILDTFQLDATLHAAESEGLINVLSAPRVATLNNERASIQSGLQIPIQTVANNTVSVQFVNATLRLDVTPQVTAEGTILMDINIQKREPQLAFAVVGATNAPIATKEARTRVIVRDGGTTVIGGIYEVSTDQGEDRVPGLASVPLIKHLFKNKRRQDENEELLIFITPRVTKL